MNFKHKDSTEELAPALRDKGTGSPRGSSRGEEVIDDYHTCALGDGSRWDLKNIASVLFRRFKTNGLARELAGFPDWDKRTSKTKGKRRPKEKATRVKA